MARIVKFKVIGLSSILMNNPASMGSGFGDGLGMKKIPSPKDEAAAKVYRTEDGQLYIPSIAFRSAIIGKGGGATGRRIGKFSAPARFSAGVFTVGNECPLMHAKTGKPIKEYKINICRAVVQGSGVQRARPEVEDWACHLVLEIDEDFLTVKQVEEILNISGKVAGIMDFRPQKKGVHGRFRVELVAS